MSEPLSGVRVLLVEDEAMIAMMAEDMLDMLGCVVAQSAATLSEALDAADGTDFDVAMLDINLNGELSDPVAVLLKDAGKPFIFTTGYGALGRRDAFAHAPLVPKPYSSADLATALASALGR